jgi:ATP-dependent protease HslVU (ClpYQ) peptidase subunit
MVGEGEPILSKGDKNTVPNEDDVFKKICEILKQWERIAYVLRLIHILLVIITTVSSVYVAATVDSVNSDSANIFFASPNTIALAALIAAVSAALLAGVDVGV